MNFCSKCGNKILLNSYPLKCSNCLTDFFNNPIPIIVLLVPTLSGKVLIQKRNIEPEKGKFALISGYMEKGETPEITSSREALEECGININKINFKGFEKSNSGNLLILLESEPIEEKSILFVPNEEVSEILLIDKYQELAFPSHSIFLKKYFSKN